MTETSKLPKKEDKRKKGGAGIWILLAILALMISAILGWMYSKESEAFENCQSANRALELEMGEMNKALGTYIEGTTNDLRKDFQNMLDTYDRLVEKDESKADSIEKQKARIEELLEQLSDTRKRSYREINKLKDENATLRVIMKDYLYRIDSLNTLNIDLTNRLDQTTDRLTQTVSERDELKKQQKESEQLLAKGGRLNAFNFNTVGLRYRVNGSTHEVNRANRIDVISSTFSIGENTIAIVGDKTIYMQIIDPNGKVIYNRANNIINVAGSEIIYTDSRDIFYNGELIDLTIVHNLQGREIDKGNYTVKIFADGAMIGKDSFTLK
jgi:hypothetical protein